MKGVLIGGGVGGLLSSIPLLNYGNCLCCLWVLVGAALAALMHVKGSGEAVSKGAGTVTGLISSAVMTGMYLVIGVPLGWATSAITNPLIAEMISDPSIRAQLSAQEAAGFGGMMILNTIIVVVVFGVVAAGFGALGGLIGTAIFEKRQPEAPPGGFGGQPPTGQPPMGQPPTGQPPMGQPPMGQPPTGQPPM